MPSRLPDRARSRAVLVGVGAYQRLSRLPAAARNAEALARLLAVGCVTVIDPGDVAAVLDPLRTAATQAEDVLLVYFAGHGLLLGGRHDLHLAVGGTDADKPWTAVPYAQVADLVRDSVAAVKVVILDCCYSGRATGVSLTPMAAGEDALEQVDVEGAFVIASSPATSYSYAPPDEAFTAFTGRLIDELTDTAAGTDAVPLGELFKRLRRRLRAAGMPEPQQSTTNTAASLALVAAGTPKRAEKPASAERADSPGLPAPRYVESPRVSHYRPIDVTSPEFAAKRPDPVLPLIEPASPAVVASVPDPLPVRSRRPRRSQDIYSIWHPRNRIVIYFWALVVLIGGGSLVVFVLTLQGK